jgi:predicted nucleotidyltransferase
MMSSIDALVENIRTVLINAPEVEVAFLFGSAARDRLRFDSDVDIAIAGYNKLPIHRFNELSGLLSGSISRPVDLIDLVSTKGLVFHQALTKGIQIMVKNRVLLSELMKECVYFGEDFLPYITGMLERKCRRFANV